MLYFRMLEKIIEAQGANGDEERLEQLQEIIMKEENEKEEREGEK